MASSRFKVMLPKNDGKDFPTGSPIPEEHRKIFIGGLSTHTKVDKLFEYFGKFGEVTDAVVMRDLISNRSRGFGFVTFADSSVVDVIQAIRSHQIDNKPVEIKRALPRPFANKSFNGMKTTKIFLGGIKECHTEEIIRNYFSKFGKILSLKLLIDKKSGRKRGFGFLDYEDSAAADRALAQGKHSINSFAIEVKKTTLKADSIKRTRMPVGGAARAGYAPPQPAIIENSPGFNPYIAQYALPPSAYINGWASYIAPNGPSSTTLSPYPYCNYQYQLHNGNINFKLYPYNNNNITTDHKNNHNSNIGGGKERPRNEYKSVQAVAAAKKSSQTIHTGDNIILMNDTDVGASGDAGMFHHKWANGF